MPVNRYSLCMVGSAGCWGTATVLSKAALEKIPAATLLAGQLLASAAFLWILCLGRRIVLRKKMSWSWPTAALGVLEPGLAYTFGIFGLQITQASVASLIMGTEPLLVLVIGALVFGVRVEKRSWCLALLGFLGIALMLEQGSSINSSLLGALLLVLGTGCAAFYVLLSGRLAQSIDPLSAAACQQTVALVFILIVFLLRPSLGELYGTAPQKLIWIAVSGIVQYALSVWLYLAAIRRIEPQQAALYLNLIPLFGLSCSILFLQERLLAIQWCGAVIVLASLVFRTGRRRAIVLRP